MCFEVREAESHFALGGWAVAEFGTGFWAPVHDISNVDVRTLEAHGLDDFGEELSGLSDKWFAFDFFISAWSFPAKEDIGVDIAYAEDNFFAGFDVAIANRAVKDFVFERIPLSLFVALGEFEMDGLGDGRIYFWGCCFGDGVGGGL